MKVNTQILCTIGLTAVQEHEVGPKPIFNFRQMMHYGRGGLIILVVGSSQLKLY
jgi:hypothetical protein